MTLVTTSLFGTMGRCSVIHTDCTRCASSLALFHSSLSALLPLVLLVLSVWSEEEKGGEEEVEGGRKGEREGEGVREEGREGRERRKRREGRRGGRGGRRKGERRKGEREGERGRKGREGERKEKGGKENGSGRKEDTQNALTCNFSTAIAPPTHLHYWCIASYPSSCPQIILIIDTPSSIHSSTARMTRGIPR